MWEKKTCIKYFERTYEKYYVEFVDGGFGNHEFTRNNLISIARVVYSIYTSEMQK